MDEINMSTMEMNQNVEPSIMSIIKDAAIDGFGFGTGFIAAGVTLGGLVFGAKFVNGKITEAKEKRAEKKAQETEE